MIHKNKKKFYMKRTERRKPAMRSLFSRLERAKTDAWFSKRKVMVARAILLEWNWWCEQ